MRTVLIALVFCATISGCASFRDGDQPIGGLFDLTPLNPWLRAGISYRDQLEWQNIGCMTTDSARAWIDVGFTLDDAKTLRRFVPFGQNGCIYAIQTVSKWKSAGFSTAEISEWLDNYNTFSLSENPTNRIQPELANLWKAAGFEAKEALFWLNWEEIRNYPSKAAQLKKAGISKNKVHEWSHYVSNSPDEVAIWVSNGISLDAAEDWKKRGFTAISSKAWVDEGFVKPHEAEEWKTVNFEPTEANRWKTARFNKNTAMQWKDAGFTADSAEKWQKSKLEPKEATLWREAGKLPEESLKWPGLNPGQADKIKNDCPNGLLNLIDLLRSNPYDVAVNCYNYTGKTIQLLSRTDALFSTGGNDIAHIRFKEQSAPIGYFKGAVKGVGTYKYNTISGAPLIVPDLEALMVLAM